MHEASSLEILAEALGEVAGRVERELGATVAACVERMEMAGRLREAEHRAAMAELAAATARVGETERRLAERLAAPLEPPDGREHAAAAVAPALARLDAIERQVASLPAPPEFPNLSLIERAFKAEIAADIARVRADLEACRPEVGAAELDAARGEARTEIEGLRRAIAALPSPPADMSAEVRALTAEVATLRNMLAALPPVPELPEMPELPDIPALVADAVEAGMKALPAPPEPVTVEDLRPLIDAAAVKAVASLPKAEPGKPGVGVAGAMIDRAGQLVLTLSDGAVKELGVVVGSSVDKTAVAEMVDAAVAAAVAALPAPEPPAGITLDDVAPIIRDEVAKAVDALPAPEPGPPGKLPQVRDWTDRVHYEGEVVTCAGGLWQASRDTGREPPHADWTCLARAGRDGLNGRSLRVRGTWAEGETYGELDVVALNGASFIARRADPGPCPGEGWQMVAGQGKQGKPGLPGAPGKPGPVTMAAVVAARISDDGMLTLANADGTEVECDLYPVLSRLG